MRSLAVLAAVLIVCFVIWLKDPTTQANREMATEYQRRELQLQQAQSEYDFAQYQQRQNTIAPFWNAATVGLMLLLVIGTAGGTVAAVLWMLKGAVLVKPDSRGLLPLLPNQLQDGQQYKMLELYHIARIEEARRAIPPHVYAPHLSYRHDNRALTIDDDDEPEDDGRPKNVPTFQELWRSGKVGQGSGLLLGLDALTLDGVYGEWRDLYSSAILGVQGSGKTTTASFLAGQSALNGAQFIVCDPDGEADGMAYEQTLTYALDPLSNLYLRKPATSQRAIIASITEANRLMHERIDGKTKDEWPLIVWFDEFNALMRDPKIAQLLGPFLEEIATRGRKRNVFSALLLHQAQASRAGGSELRDVLASAYVHRVKRRIAAMVLGMPASEMPETLQFTEGEALLYRTKGTLAHVVVPNTTRQDIEAVSLRLRGSTSAGYVPLTNQGQAAEQQGDESEVILTNDPQYWAEVHLAEEQGGVVAARDLYASYTYWCEGHDLQPLNQTAFGLALSRLGHQKRRSNGGYIEYTNVALIVTGEDELWQRSSTRETASA